MVDLSIDFDELARVFAHDYRREIRDFDGSRSAAAYVGYMEGAKATYAKLTKWFSPALVLPSDDGLVLTKLRRRIPYSCDSVDKIFLGRYTGDCWNFVGIASQDYILVAWKPIV